MLTRNSPIKKEARLDKFYIFNKKLWRHEAISWRRQRFLSSPPLGFTICNILQIFFSRRTSSSIRCVEAIDFFLADL